MTDATLRIKVDSSEVDKSKKSLDGLADSAGKADKSSEHLTKTTSGLSNAAKAAGAAFVALGGSMVIRQAIEYADAWQNATNQLKTVQGATEDLTTTQRSLMAVANETRAGFETTANLYTRLARSTESLNLTQGELIDLTETINKSFAVSGASATEASNAIIQLSQGLAAGALRGEEFNSVSEQSPILMQAIADSLQMTRGELRAFAAEGGITAEIVVTALQEASGEIDNTFSKMSATFEQNMTIAKNNMLEFVGTSEGVQNATAAAGAAIVTLSENLNYVGTALGAVAAIFTARMIPAVASSAAAFVASTAPVVTYNAALMVTQRNSVLAATATSSLRGALSLIGGPSGAIILAAGAAYLLAQRFIEAKTAFTDFSDQVDSVANVSIEQARINYERAGEDIQRLNEAVQTATQIYGENSSQVAELNIQLDRQHNWRNLNRIAMEKETEATSGATGGTGALSDEVQKLIASLENEGIALTKSGVELEIFNALTKAGVAANSEAGVRIAALVAANYELAESIKADQKATEDATDAAKRLREEKEKLIQKINDTVIGYRQQQAALVLTGKQQYIYNAIVSAGAMGNAELATQVATAAAALYDQELAIKSATDATEFWTNVAEQGADRRSQAEKAAADASQRNWERTHEFVTATILDIADNGGSAFERLGDVAVATAQRIAAEWLALKGLELFGIPMPAGSSGSSGGFNFSSLLSGGSSINSLTGGALVSGAGGFLSGLTGSATGIAAGTVGPPTAAAAAGAGFGANAMAFATNPATLAIAAALAAFAAHKKFSDPDNYTRSFAGLLTAPTAGAAGLTFDAGTFESGFRATGIAKGASQEQAMQSIDLFRAVDKSVTDAIRALGGNIDLSNATLSGTGLDGRAGTSGTFLGMGGKTTAEDIASMLTQFTGDLLNHVTGIDEELLKTVKAAGSAEEAIKLLTEAVKAQEKPLNNFEIAQKKAAESVLNAYNSGMNELDAIDLAYKQFQQYAERGLTSEAIANFTGLMQSEIDAVLARGKAAAGQSAKGATQGWSLFGSSSETVLKNLMAPIPAFANGGIHSGGWRLVGEKGPELEFTSPSRIFSAAETKSMMNKPAANDSMMTEMRDMLAEMRTMAFYTKRTSDLLLRVTRDGESLVTVPA